MFYPEKKKKGFLVLLIISVCHFRRTGKTLHLLPKTDYDHFIYCGDLRFGPFYNVGDLFWSPDGLSLACHQTLSVTNDKSFKYSLLLTSERCLTGNFFGDKIVYFDDNSILIIDTDELNCWDTHRKTQEEYTNCILRRFEKNGRIGQCIQGRGCG